MSDDELTDIRKQKREQLESELRSDGKSAAEEASVSSTESVHVDGTDELDGAIASYDMVFVDFYVDWYGLCKVLEPAVKKLVKNTDAAVARADVDTNQELVTQYQVRDVPMMVLFADGEAVEQLVGIRNYDDLRNLVETHLTQAFSVPEARGRFIDSLARPLGMQLIAEYIGIGTRPPTALLNESDAAELGIHALEHVQPR